MTESLAVEPLAGYEREVGAALWRLQDARDRTLRLLADVPPPHLDRDDGGNAIGTILYHVALIEADWLYSEILEQEPGPEVAALLPADHRDADGVLTVVAGETLEQHLARLATVRADLLDRLRGMTVEEFHRLRRLPAYDVSPAWVLHHLAQHDAEHRGEIGSLVSRLNLTG